MAKRSAGLPGSRPLTRAERLRLQLEGTSSWETMVAVANRSGVLRCPECGRIGTWEDTPERRRVHLEAIPTHSGREAAGSDVRGGAKVHAMIGQEWRCGSCKAPPTRDPKVGRIGSVRENTMTGHGSLVNNVNTVEDALVDLCFTQERAWKRDGFMSERDDNVVQMLPSPEWYTQPEPPPWDAGTSAGPRQLLAPVTVAEMEQNIANAADRASAQDAARSLCRGDHGIDTDLWLHLTAVIDERYPLTT